MFLAENNNTTEKNIMDMRENMRKILAKNTHQ